MSLRAALRTSLKRFFFSLGVDVNGLAVSSSERALTFKLLKLSGATSVVDVGANTGQFAQELLLLKRDVKILSFEPLSSAHAILTKNARGAKNWKVAERMALGAQSAKTRINIAGNSASSSLRKMNAAHSTAAPTSRYIGQEDVDVKTLDDVCPTYFEPWERIYLKIDAQGYEAEILAGSEKILPQVVALQTEASLVELYEGQTLALDILRHAEKLGFKLFGVANGFSNPSTGELLQVDLYFIRSAEFLTSQIDVHS